VLRSTKRSCHHFWRRRRWIIYERPYDIIYTCYRCVPRRNRETKLRRVK
jgi:hypothetical protein